MEAEIRSRVRKFCEDNGLSEEATIVQSYRGYGVRTDDRREINRIEHWEVEFIEK